jgi:hypothetical protein
LAADSGYSCGKGLTVENLASWQGVTNLVLARPQLLLAAASGSEPMLDGTGISSVLRRFDCLWQQPLTGSRMSYNSEVTFSGSTSVTLAPGAEGSFMFDSDAGEHRLWATNLSKPHPPYDIQETHHIFYWVVPETSP